MANLSELIRQKEQQTEEWKQRKADERDSLNEMNDAAALRVTESNERLQKVGELVEKYSSILEYTQYIPGVGSYMNALPKVAKAFGGRMRKNAGEKLKDAVYQKKEIEKELLLIDSRILVVIDDIDRLPNDQIRLIFQLVNSVAGFPHMVYLLSYDKDIVARALDDVQGYTDIASFDEITALMVSVERNYKNTCENTGERLVDENEIDVLRTMYLQRIREFTENTFLLNSPMAQEATMLWRKIDCANYKKYIGRICQDDICAVRVLATFVGEWHNNGKVGTFELSGDSYAEVMNQEKAIDVIGRARTEGGFWDLQQDDIIRIAAFSLLVEKNAGDKKMAEIDEVNKRVAEWKEEYEAQQ